MKLQRLKKSLLIVCGAMFALCAFLGAGLMNAGKVKAAYDDATYLNSMAVPYWTTDVMYNETVLMLTDDGTNFAGDLLYVPVEVLSVMNHDRTVTYTAGVNYTVSGKKIVGVSGLPGFHSSITNSGDTSWIDGNTYTNVGSWQDPRGISGNNYCVLENSIYTEGNLFRTNYLQVTYTYDPSQVDNTILTQHDASKLTGLRAKLEAGQSISMLTIGDSITAGCSTTGEMLNCAPYQPSYTTLVAKEIERIYGVSVNIVRCAVGGTESDYLLSSGEYHTSYVSGTAGQGASSFNTALANNEFDLAIIAYGMNDQGANRSKESYKHNIKATADKLLADSPNCNIVFVNTFPRSPMADAGKDRLNRYADYLAALNELSSDYGTAKTKVINMYAVGDHYMTTLGKAYSEISSSNYNHPNDFFHRIYAQNVMAAIVDYSNTLSIRGVAYNADYSNETTDMALVDFGHNCGQEWGSLVANATTHISLTNSAGSAKTFEAIYINSSLGIRVSKGGFAAGDKLTIKKTLDWGGKKLTADETYVCITANGIWMKYATTPSNVTIENVNHASWAGHVLVKMSAYNGIYDADLATGVEALKWGSLSNDAGITYKDSNGTSKLTQIAYNTDYLHVFASSYAAGDKLYIPAGVRIGNVVTSRSATYECQGLDAQFTAVIDPETDYIEATPSNVYMWNTMESWNARHIRFNLNMSTTDAALVGYGTNVPNFQVEYTRADGQVRPIRQIIHVNEGVIFIRPGNADNTDWMEIDFGLGDTITLKSGSYITAGSSVYKLTKDYTYVINDVSANETALVASGSGSSDITPTLSISDINYSPVGQWSNETYKAILVNFSDPVPGDIKSYLTVVSANGTPKTVLQALPTESGSTYSAVFLEAGLEWEQGDRITFSENLTFGTERLPAAITYEYSTLNQPWTVYTGPATPTTYTVSFNVNGGSSVASQTITSGQKATRPATDPTKSGFTFGGWYSDSSCTTEFNFNTAITQNTTIYTKWTENSVTPPPAPTTYTVSFNVNGGSSVASQTITSGQTATRPEVNPTKSGYTFGGWYSDSDCTIAFNFNATITEDTVVYAKWTPVQTQSCLVSFDANGGTGAMSAVLVDAGSSYTLPTCTFTAPEGKQFKGWARSENGSVIIDTTITVTEAVTLYAIWEDVGGNGGNGQTTVGCGGAIGGGSIALLGLALAGVVVARKTRKKED